MLKDKDGKWVENLEIAEELWKRTIEETLHGTVRLLQSAEKLLEGGGDEAICAGLYTYAVEEYGKILLLKQYTPSAGKVTIKFKDLFRAHSKKFGAAADNLPKECTTLKGPVFDPRVFDSRVFDTKEVIADFEARTAIFYCDLLDSADGIRPVPQVDMGRLTKAIRTLQTKTLEI